MPEISRFYGITIKMFYNEHNPPHIHAEYNEYKATFDIKSAQMTNGNFPTVAKKLVKKWIKLHRAELLNIWDSHEFKEIRPLDD